MTELRFFDGQLNPLMQTDKIISLNISKKFRGFGTVEIHFPVTRHDVIEMLDAYPCLICCTPQMTAVITGWRIGEDIAIFGRTAEWLLAKRYLPSFTLAATPMGLARYGVETGAGDFADVSAPDDTDSETEYAFEGMTSVYDVVMKALETTDCGFSLRADTGTKRFVMSIYKGQDKNLILSHSARTACEISYTCDLQERSSNSGWYLREFEYEGTWNPAVNSPELYQVSESRRFSCYRITKDGTRFDKTFAADGYAFYDRDGVIQPSDTFPSPQWDYLENPDASGADRWDTVVDEAKALEQATADFEKLQVKTEAAALLRHVEYGKDYNLGDRIRIQAEFGDFRKTVHKTVTGVDIFYDTDGSGCCPVME